MRLGRSKKSEGDLGKPRTVPSGRAKLPGEPPCGCRLTNWFAPGRQPCSFHHQPLPLWPSCSTKAQRRLGGSHRPTNPVGRASLPGQRVFLQDTSDASIRPSPPEVASMAVSRKPADVVVGGADAASFLMGAARVPRLSASRHSAQQVEGRRMAAVLQVMEGRCGLYSTRQTPVPFVISPMIQALCFSARITLSTASVCSSETMATMPMPMLKTW